MAERRFLFDYHFGGFDWGFTVTAHDPAEAKEKIKAVALARYKGELMAVIPAYPGAGLLVRLLTWWRNRPEQG